MLPFLHIVGILKQYLFEILANQETIKRSLKEITRDMATQADIDALTAQVTANNPALAATLASIATDTTKIEAEIASLKAANPAIDLTALTAAVAGLATNAQAAATEEAQLAKD